MKKFNVDVIIHAKALRVEAEDTHDAICEVYDKCKNHSFLVVESIEVENITADVTEGD